MSIWESQEEALARANREYRRATFSLVVSIIAVVAAVAVLIVCIVR